MLFFVVSSLIFLADQAIKYHVHNLMFVNQSIPVIDGIMSLTYVRNKGAAFSLFSGESAFLIIVGALVVAAIIYFHEKMEFNDFLQFPLAMLLGGSVGNIFDRIFRTYVIDYIDFHFFPVFNLADIAINISVFLIILRLFYKGRKV
ncbi:signal peptidase II [Candidatus Saganbacteria bacterium]|nr:signal peptidase II [Candidatus Saganbacteria bacterium]